MKYIYTLSLLIGIFASGKNQTDILPGPTGQFKVGVTYLSLVDTNRKELFDNNLDNFREITVKAWYPSDINTGYEPYLLSSESDFVINNLQYPEIYRILTSNSSRDTPVSVKEIKYPVLIFSHGWGEHYSQNTIQMEELASHGYIIFSLSHHYECKFSSYPDGRIFYIDINNQRFQKIIGEMSSPMAGELINKMFSAGNDQERMQVFEETGKALSTVLSDGPKYWAEDISFFIDQLKWINNNNKIFRQKLDLLKIGTFGMSMGGIASCEVSLTDKRIKACANIDGGLYGSILKTKTRVPVMFLNSKRYLGYGNLFSDKSEADCYSFSVSNSDHYNFTDYALYPVPSVQPLLGSIDGTTGEKIMNVMLLSFFDRYLKGIQYIDLIKEAGLFKEIEIATNLNLR